LTLLQPIEFVTSAAIGALLVVAVAVLRIYLGWAYVGDRLLSAAVEYEETGWYDGQVRFLTAKQVTSPEWLRIDQPGSRFRYAYPRPQHCFFLNGEPCMWCRYVDRCRRCNGALCHALADGCCACFGQLFVKPPEVLARDRLLGSYEVSLSF